MAGPEDRISALEARIGAMEKAMAVDAVIGQGIATRLDKIEDTLTWLVRLIIGSILLALVAFVVRGGVGPV